MRVRSINLPYVLEPPDLVVVELLEALPGQPISGERLVRPDGTISLGFYGDVQVRGLSLPQVKVAIIKHMRIFLSDEMLGLAVSEETQPADPQPEQPPVPPLPGNATPFDENEAPKPAKKTSRAISPRQYAGRASRRMTAQNFGGRRVPVWPAADRVGDQDRAQLPEANRPPAAENARGAVTIVQPAVLAAEGRWKIVPPEASDRVFVDVTRIQHRWVITSRAILRLRADCPARETKRYSMRFNSQTDSCRRLTRSRSAWFAHNEMESPPRSTGWTSKPSRREVKWPRTIRSFLATDCSWAGTRSSRRPSRSTA